MTLKYLFTAHFTDGTSLVQTPEDVSLLDEQRSCFYDVLQNLEDGKQLASFTLEGDGHTYAVDLLDGHFETDGAPFWIVPEGMTEDPDAFRIIYYRRHTHDFNAGSGEETAHTVRYVLGWQCNDAQGRNFQQTIGVD